jgi:hypothetical protein
MPIWIDVMFSSCHNIMFSVVASAAVAGSVSAPSRQPMRTTGGLCPQVRQEAASSYEFVAASSVLWPGTPDGTEKASGSSCMVGARSPEKESGAEVVGI